MVLGELSRRDPSQVPGTAPKVLELGLRLGLGSGRLRPKKHFFTHQVAKLCKSAGG